MSYQGAYDKIVYKLEHQLPALLTYHNLNHAQRVMKSIDSHLQTLDFYPRKAELVRLAGIGHDIGFIETYEGHEEKSIQILKNILQEEGYSEEEIYQVSVMVWATKLDIEPRTFMEKMLVDADLEYLGSDDFSIVLECLFQEWVNYNFIPENYQLFLENSLKFMEAHRYETDYSKAYSKKTENIFALRTKLNLD